MGLSPCPNDTFIFGALIKGLFSPRQNYAFFLEDVETLNQWALSSKLPVTKLSFGVFPEVATSYQLLPVGAALGFGCGPLLVAREEISDLSRVRVAVPGLHTTAYLLLRLYAQELGPVVPLRYDRIIPALLSGEVEAGLLIHEGRFVYREYGLLCLEDLGRWWEEKTALPLPLGGIFVRRDLPVELKRAILEDLRESLFYARRYPEAVWDFILKNAQEMAPETIKKHLAAFVNDFTYDLGPEGRGAVSAFFVSLRERGFLSEELKDFLFEG